MQTSGERVYSAGLTSRHTQDDYFVWQRVTPSDTLSPLVTLRSMRDQMQPLGQYSFETLLSAFKENANESQ